MHREKLLVKLHQYRTPFMEEAAMVDRSIRFVRAHHNCFDRNLAVGHVTASSWVVNRQRTHTLMLLHRKLNRWFQPGGHADGDSDAVQVALKETSEESGIDLADIKLLDEAIFDVDVHTIYPSAHDHRHEHFDMRFLLEIDDQIPIPGNNESHQITWIPLTAVSRFNNMRSLHRMVRKTYLRFRSVA